MRDRLFAAARAGDARTLERLARANEAAVFEHFRSWQRVPEGIRSDSAAAESYIRSLVAVAEVFSRLGRPELMAALTDPEGGNPIQKWQEALRRARELIGDLRYDEARSILADALIDARKLSGSAVTTLTPITQGHLAEAYFHDGRAAEAVTHLEHALRACERSGEAAGLVAYLSSLFEAHRYLGQADAAARYAHRLAATIDGPAGTWWRARARIVRAGEPLNRVVAVVDGQAAEVDQVRPGPGMRVTFTFERNRIALRPAVVLTERGQRMGASGRFEAALSAFEAAAAADPFDPDCRFHLAFSLVHLRRYEEAAGEYGAVEGLAPGWFQCRADRWVADQLVAGRLDHDDFLALGRLQDGDDPPKSKLALSGRLLRRRPDLPAGHLGRARALAALGRPAEAREALLAGLAADPEPDVRTRILVDLANLTADPAERSARFREAIAIGGNLVAAASAALILRRG